MFIDRELISPKNATVTQRPCTRLLFTYSLTNTHRLRKGRLLNKNGVKVGNVTIFSCFRRNCSSFTLLIGSIDDLTWDYGNETLHRPSPNLAPFTIRQIGFDYWSSILRSPDVNQLTSVVVKQQSVALGDNCYPSKQSANVSTGWQKHPITELSTDLAANKSFVWVNSLCIWFTKDERH